MMNSDLRQRLGQAEPSITTLQITIHADCTNGPSLYQEVYSDSKQNIYSIPRGAKFLPTWNLCTIILSVSSFSKIHVQYFNFHTISKSLKEETITLLDFWKVISHLQTIGKLPNSAITHHRRQCSSAAKLLCTVLTISLGLGKGANAYYINLAQHTPSLLTTLTFDIQKSYQ
jgi:hypothetical protein